MGPQQGFRAEGGISRLWYHNLFAKCNGCEQDWLKVPKTGL